MGAVSKTYIEKLKIIEFYKNGNNQKECKDYFKISLRTLKNILNEFKIEIRKPFESEKKSRKLTTLNFIEKVEKIHNFKYNYDNTLYINYEDKVKIICPIHGEFKQRASSHLKGFGCKLCGDIKCKDLQRSNTEDFIKKSINVHGNSYDYSETIYGKNAHNKVKIICKKHGVFEQIPNSHLSGRGCIKCHKEFNRFLKKEWVKNGKGRTGILYLIKFVGNNEIFYKIGITFVSVKSRYKGKEYKYKYEIISQIKSTDLNYIWDLEHLIKKKLKPDRYLPKIPFPGSVTECFNKITTVSDIIWKEKQKQFKL